MKDPGKRILYLQYTNPAAYPPLQHSSRILAERGWWVRFLGTRARGGADTLRFPPHPRVTVQQWQYCEPGIRQKLHYFAYGLWALWTTVWWRPQWIYASDPLSCPFGLALSFLPGVRQIYHEHDSPGVREPASQAEDGSKKENQRTPSSGFQRFVLWTRRKLAKRAALSVLPNERRVSLFKETTETNGPVRCVWNCPSRDEVPPDSSRRRPDVYYHGNIGPQLMPPTVIDALAKDRVFGLRVVGYTASGCEAHPARLLTKATELGISDRVAILPPAVRSELLALARECSVGIALMPMSSEDVNYEGMVGASNKVFDYLACGLAVIVSDLSEWKTTFVDAGYGLACNPDDAESIASALRWFATHPEETRDMGFRGRLRVMKEWNYETQFEPVLRALEGFERAND